MSIQTATVRTSPRVSAAAIVLCASLTVTAAPASGGPYTYRTLAGHAARGSGDGTGAAALFSSPSGVAADASGNVYVVDTMGNTIRKIAPGGVVSTLAGDAGVPGHADGPGRAAQFGYPSGIAVDASGTVYVADTANATIRKITPAGMVSTLAGKALQFGSADGTGSAARFDYPYGIAVDGTGTVYVADTHNSTIRKITPEGVVTTLAGRAGRHGFQDGMNGAARFNRPLGIAVDGSGVIYVADTYNQAIRKVTPAGLVSVLAGGFYGTDDGPGTTATFAWPYGITSDSGGTLFVVDNASCRIRRVSPAAVVSTVAGGVCGAADGTGSAAAFNSPFGVTVDGTGTAFVGDSGNNTIRQVTSLGVVTTLAGAVGGAGTEDGTGVVARFSGPIGIAVDRAGSVYVADTYNHTIRKITPAGKVTTFAGTPGASGATDGRGAAARFSYPQGIAVDGAGFVYVADSSNNLIRKIAPDGLVTTLAGGAAGSADGTGTAAQFRFPAGVAVDATGQLYVADSLNHTIRTITPDAVVTTLAGTAGTSGSADGFGAAAQFNVPAGVAVDRAGTVFVADTYNHRVRKIAPDGLVSTLAGQDVGEHDGTGPAAQFFFPEGIAVDLAGNVFVADASNTTIRKITPAGAVTTVGGSASRFDSSDGVGTDARFYRPGGIAVSNGARLYIADTGNDTIREGDLPIGGSDFDSDLTSDLTVFRPSTGVWYIRQSREHYTTFASYAWGLGTDVTVPGDYDGDGVGDIAMYRPSTGIWYILTSSSNYASFVSYSWGLAGDVPAPGDYDGDGRNDIAAFRPSTGAWYILQSSSDYSTFVTYSMGNATDTLVQQDYDGDGRTDIAVYRPSTGTWSVLQSTTGYTTSVTYLWGAAGDVTVPGDYDGDGRADVAVYRPSTGTWFVLQSNANYTTYFSIGWGTGADVPVPGDFDGDHRSDPAVFRPSTGTWYILRSSSDYADFVTHSWGVGTDVAVYGRR